MKPKKNPNNELVGTIKEFMQPKHKERHQRARNMKISKGVGKRERGLFVWELDSTLLRRTINERYGKKKMRSHFVRA